MDENPNVVNDDLTNQQVSETKTQEVEVVATPAPGSKTPPELLLKSLQEERDKIKKLEEEKRIWRKS